MKGESEATTNARADEEPAAVWVQTSSLLPWVKNPRKNDDNVGRVAESIKRFGFSAPIVARKTNGEIIAGHTRLKAAMLLGLAKVPVRYMDLDPADAHLLALADNRLNELSPWDTLGLQEVMTEFGLEDLALAGWNEDDLSKMANDYRACGGGDIAQVVPSAPYVTAVARGRVFDPFLGSGTTLVAAEQLGRTCVGFELSPAYCDVIVERWENLTGGKVVRNAP